MSGELSRGTARWKYSTGEDAGYLQIDEKTPEALLQLGIAFIRLLRSIGGRGWSSALGIVDSKYEIPLFKRVSANVYRKIVRRQYLAGSFTGAVPS